MKILFLTTRLPYPLDGGAKIRTWHLFSYAAGRHDVEFVNDTLGEFRLGAEQAGPLECVLPVAEPPAPGLDEPVGSRVEAVDQEEQNG